MSLLNAFPENTGGGTPVPNGGSANQVLAKNSATDGDLKWVNQTSYTQGTGISISNGTISSTVKGNVDYSTSEVNTGVKWIDGKDIYRKVISFTTPANSNTTNVSGSPSISALIAIYGYWNVSSTVKAPLPFAQGSSTIVIGTSGATLQCTISPNFSAAYSKSALMVVEYTK